MLILDMLYYHGKSWGIHQSYKTTTKRWMLCLNKKLAIALRKQDNILNKRTEIRSRCRCSDKYNLAKYDAKE